MLFLRRPTAEAIRAFLANQGRLDLTYSAVGATAMTPPVGYVVDHTRYKLGAGEKVFAPAKAALERWQQFRLGWLEASPEDTPIKEGQVVAILARSIGLWWLNACRIVAVINEDAFHPADVLLVGNDGEGSRLGHGHALGRRILKGAVAACSYCRRTGLFCRPGVLGVTPLSLAGSCFAMRIAVVGGGVGGHPPGGAVL